MSGYRDDHEAAVARAESLEAELSQVREGRDADQDRIAQLEAELAAKRNAIAQMQAGYAPGYGAYPALPSNATNVLILGVLGIALCQVLGPVAWVMANKELAAIDNGEADPTKRGTVMAGKITGIVATVMIVLMALWMAFGFIVSLSTSV
jgi:hypothetical protein